MVTHGRWAAAIVALLACGACSILIDADGLVSRVAGPDASAPSDATAPSDAAVEASPPVEDAGLAPCPEGAPDPTLLAWFTFEDGPHGRLTDCSNSHLDASVLGPAAGATGVEGRVGAGAIDLAGATCFDLGEASKIVFPLTVAAWIRPRTLSLPSGTPRFLVGRADKTDIGWNVATDLVGQERRVEVKIRRGPGGIVETEMALPESRWVHVAGIFLATSIQVFVDGVPKSPIAHTSATADPSAHVLLGCHRPETGFFDGAVDDLRIYGRALDAKEIETLAR